MTKRMHSNDLKMLEEELIFLVPFRSQIFGAFLTLFGLSHFGVFKCNFFRFLCGKVLYLHKLYVISMFIIGRMLI